MLQDDFIRILHLFILKLYKDEKHDEIYLLPSFKSCSIQMINETLYIIDPFQYQL